MRRFLAFIMILALVSCLAACNGSTGSGETSDTEGGSIGSTDTTKNETTRGEDESGQGGGSYLPDINAPGPVAVVIDESVLELSSRGAIWGYVSNNGEEIGITEDARHPLSTKEALDVLVIDDGQDARVTLHFWCGILPDTLTVLCWEYGCEPENAENTVEVIELTDPESYIDIYGGYSFVVREDGEYVYMIKANWSEDNYDAFGFCGYLDYAFRTSVRGEVQ